MITIHLILQAHIDPIWLWPWQEGLDAALATCRSACDRLDRHADVIFTRGEAWVYRQIQRVDAELFGRIRKHVEAGRWEIVGGWWLQPDCNLPSGFAFRRQMELGRRYFSETFGCFPRVGYNVDSFGHAATLPTMMRAAGQDCYVMMRPQEHEMKLPARLFRWREKAGSPEVVTFRIAGAYNSPGRMEEGRGLEHVKRSLSELPAGIGHTMCFIGIGDHGGGPTERAIAWCRENRDAVSGARLAFSSPSRFFAAIRRDVKKLPVVTGELQHHAIGCYSVYRSIKTAVRRSEHLLEQAEVVHKIDPRPEEGTAAKLEEGWRQVCFAHFHDVLGGSCTASAVPQVEAQLGAARAGADEAIQLGLRRRMGELPEDALQRMVLLNASDSAFAGYVEAEPWLAWTPWEPGWRVLDERGRQVPVQLVEREALVNRLSRILFRVRAGAGEMRVLRIDRSGNNKARAEGTSSIRVAADRIAAGNVAFRANGSGRMALGEIMLAVPRLDLIEDLSDTWSHHTDRYGEKPAATATWEPATIADRGPLMASLIQKGRVGESRLVAEWRVYAGEAFVELRLRVHWAEFQKVLKLTVKLSGAIGRMDGILGGSLKREMDGRELPLRDWTLAQLRDGNRLGIVCPEVYAMDGMAGRLRMTLLRSPLVAHHVPHPGTAFRGRASDQGEHAFRFRFFGGAVTAKLLEQQAMMMQRPLVMADLTRGMAAD